MRGIEMECTNAPAAPRAKAVSRARAALRRAKLPTRGRPDRDRAFSRERPRRDLAASSGCGIASQAREEYPRTERYKEIDHPTILSLSSHEPPNLLLVHALARLNQQTGQVGVRDSELLPPPPTFDPGDADHFAAAAASPVLTSVGMSHIYIQLKKTNAKKIHRYTYIWLSTPATSPCQDLETHERGRGGTSLVTRAYREPRRAPRGREGLHPIYTRDVVSPPPVSKGWLRS